jgi:hypothetical protein
MKKFIIISILMALFATGTNLMAQNNNEDNLGLPGDNLNLYAVMKLFQESKTLEDFERSLNDQNSTINNLDLNGDNLVDYIKVIDNVDGDVHNIVLQVAVSPKENQDVAVFTVQRFQNGQVQIQLTGDEQLYGKDYIIEPIFDDANQGQTPNPGYTGSTRTVNGQTVTYIQTTPVQIAAWPLVRFIFMPSYTVWHSSWYWGYYPNYWHPWRPFSWNYYYGYHYNWNGDYYGHYRRWNDHRYSRWNDDYYTSRRSYSPDVRHQIQTGNYRTTYNHPEQRRDGEAMFAKMHPDQYRRTTEGSATNNSTTRRSTSTMTNTNHPSSNNTSTVRRSTSTTVTNRSVTNPHEGNNSVTNRRSTTPITNRSMTNHSPENGAITSHKSTTVTKRSMGNPSSGQNAGTNHAAVHSKTTTVSSSSRRNATKGKTGKTIKKDDKIK